MTGKGHPDFDLRPADLREILSEALSTISPGSSVLAIVADKTRDDNTDILFPLAAQILADRKIAKLDALVAQGTHAPMSDQDKRIKIGAVWHDTNSRARSHLRPRLGGPRKTGDDRRFECCACERDYRRLN